MWLECNEHSQSESYHSSNLSTWSQHAQQRTILENNLLHLAQRECREWNIGTHVQKRGQWVEIG